MEQVKGGLLPADLGPGRDLAMNTLRRTQGAMRQRGRSLGLALVLTMTVLVCLPDGQGFVSELRRDGGLPLAAVALATAGYFWWRYFAACKRLAGTGLAPARSHKTHNAWGFAGWIVGLAAGELLCAVFKLPSMLSFLIASIVGFGALWVGKQLGELAEAAQVRTVHTLFGYDNFDDDQGNG
jgi:hypothetical protein